MSDTINATFEEDTAIQVHTSAIQQIRKAELEIAIDTARRHRRNEGRALERATNLATMNQQIAEDCTYVRKVGWDKEKRCDIFASGPSIRLLEIMAACWGNIRSAWEVVDVTDDHVVVQAFAHDLETNNLAGVTEIRSIRYSAKGGRAGKRFSDQMIATTAKAAGGIAHRNALMKVIPRAFVEQVRRKAADTAYGKADDHGARLQKVVARLVELGVPEERILARCGVTKVQLITPDWLGFLISQGVALKDELVTLDEAFPPVGAPRAPDEGDEGDDDLSSKLKQSVKQTTADPADPDQANGTIDLDGLEGEDV